MVVFSYTVKRAILFCMEHLKFATDVYAWLAAIRRSYTAGEAPDAAQRQALVARAEVIHEELGCAIHSPEFVENRRLSPDDPGFYDHPHALQALADFLTGVPTRSES